MGMKFGRGPGWEKHLVELTLSTLNLILGLGHACGTGYPRHWENAACVIWAGPEYP